MDYLSPLRYPGGKAVLVDYFDSLLKSKLLLGCKFYEPYAGGASISIGLLKRGVISTAVLVEKDPLISSFWKCVMGDTDRLCAKIMKTKISLATWRRKRKYLSPGAAKKYSNLDLGFAGFFLNRTSFSGILDAGPIGGFTQSSRYDIGCRFNKERLCKLILEISRFGKKLSIESGDAVAYLKKNGKRIEKENSLVYIDPPYYVQGKKLYRHHYLEADHQKLAEFISRQKYRWIVSYDNHLNIRRMFAGQKIMPIFLNYVVKQARRADELLISNVTLIEVRYGDSAKAQSFDNGRKLATN